MPSIFCACTDVVFAIGCSGKYLYINREMAATVHINLENVIGKTAAEIENILPLLRLDPIKAQEAISNERPVTYDISCERSRGLRSAKRTLWPIQFLSNEIFALIVSDRSISDLTKNEETLCSENEDLRRSQTAYLRLFESDMLGLFSWDLSGAIFDLNQAFLNIVGYNRENAHRDEINWRKLTPPEWIEQDNVAIQELYRRGVSTPFEKEYYRKDGGRVPILIGVAFFEGSKTQGIGFVLDMSARKKAELALQQSEEHFRRLAESLPLIVWTNATDGTLEYRNCLWNEFFGVFPVENFEETIRTRTHPDDVTESLRYWRDAKVNEKSFELTIRLRGQAGVYRWQLIRVLPLLTEQKKIVKWVGTSTDIDDSKTFERTQTFLSDVGLVLSSSLDYDSILQAVTRLAVPSFADCVLVDILDQDGHLKDISIALQNADIHEVQVTKFQSSSRKEEHTNPILEVIRSGKLDLQAEMPPDYFQWALDDHPVEVKSLIEELRPISYLSLPLIARGRVLGAITLYYSFGRRYLPRDLFLAQQFANRASLAIDNSKLFQDAKKAIIIRDDFLSIASHELKTPVTSLRSLVELLFLGLRQWVYSGTPRSSLEMTSRFSSPQRLLAMSESANKQITRLVKLINNLLDVSKITAGKLAVELSEVNLHDLIHEVLEDISPEMERAKCPVRLSEPASMAEHPIIGRWDRYRLEQVIVNLLSNTMKYGPGKPVHVAIETNEDKARITVQDFGIGIPSQYLPRLFDRFERCSRDGATEGLGLGLYISKQIIEAHGGSISVESEQGKGSKFTVELSLRR